jgi:hypothetical protein
MAQLYQPGVKVLTSVAGTDRLNIDNGGAQVAGAPVQVIDSFNTINQQNYQVNAAIAALTPAPVGNIIGSASGSDHITLNLTGAPASPLTITTPTALALVQGFTVIQLNQTWILRIINSGNSSNWTLAGGTGVTVSGTATIAQNTWREFLFTATALTGASPNVTAATVTAQSIGTGTNS